MTFRNNDSLSSERPLNGGSPQGTLLGNYLFIITTDRLELGPNLSGDAAPEETIIRESTWDPARIGIPVRRRPSALSLDGDALATSSPLRISLVNYLSIGDDDSCDDSFDYFRPLWAPFNRINDSVASSMISMSASFEEESLPRRWIDRPLAVMKYVDDFIGCEKIAIATAFRTLSTMKTQSLIQAKKCQTFFKDVTSNSRQIGMTVNSSKTQILCISSARDSKVSAYINIDNSPEKIISQDSSKILGFTFDARPGVDAHVDYFLFKFRRRLWVLRHLKRAGTPNSNLAKLYKVLLLDYASVCYHDFQTKRLEAAQKSALRIIFGFDLSYNDLLAAALCERLCERILRLIDRFLSKAVTNERFSARWFPKKTFFFNPADPRGITKGGLPGFPTQLDIFRKWCQGLIRPQVPCTPSLHCPIANSASTQSQQPSLEQFPIQVLTELNVA